MTVAILPITEADVDGFYSALDIVVREKKYLAFLQAPPIDSTRAFVKSNVEKNHAQFVAKAADGTIVGWCDIIPQTGRQTGTHIGTLGIGLIPAYRGQGIGRKLMEAAIAKAQAQGLTRIELTVREHNTNAIALYKELGFEIEGLKKNAARIDGVYENIYMMALLS